MSGVESIESALHVERALFAPSLDKDRVSDYSRQRILGNVPVLLRKRTSKVTEQPMTARRYRHPATYAATPEAPLSNVPSGPTPLATALLVTPRMARWAMVPSCSVRVLPLRSRS